MSWLRASARAVASASESGTPEAASGVPASWAARGNARSERVKARTFRITKVSFRCRGPFGVWALRLVRAQARFLEARVDGFGEALEERSVRREKSVPLGRRQLHAAGGEFVEGPLRIPPEFLAELLVGREPSKDHFHAFLGHGGRVSRARHFTHCATGIGSIQRAPKILLEGNLYGPTARALRRSSQRRVRRNRQIGRQPLRPPRSDSFPRRGGSRAP